MSTTTVKDTLYVPYKKCMQCSLFGGSFVEDAKAYTCTAENGNSMCPAAYIKIELGAPVDRAAQDIADAIKQNDTERLGALYTRLATRPEYIQTKVKALVAALTNGVGQ